jgi:hypothetical protein
MKEKTGGVVVQAIKDDDLILILSALDALTEKLQEIEDVAEDPEAMETLEHIFDLRDRLVDLKPAIDVARAGLMPEAFRLSFLMEGRPEPQEVEYRKVA